MADGCTDVVVRKEIYGRLVACGKDPEEVIGSCSDPAFRDQLDRHFERLPASYTINLHVDKAEDVLLHKMILDECADPDKRPVFHVRFLKCIQVAADSEDRTHGSFSTFRRDAKIIRLHEIIFSSIDKPKLLSQLSALLSQLGLNIREGHVFSTSDGFSLHVFVVDGWDTEEADGLLQCLKETAARNHAYLSNPRIYSASERELELEEKIEGEGCM